MYDSHSNPPCALKQLCRVLSGHRWHATSADGLRGIVDHGAIKVCTFFNSFCKSIGAVSIFHFGPTAKDCETTRQHWSPWCGKHQADPLGIGHPVGKQVGIWLRIRDVYQGPQLIEPLTLCQRSYNELKSAPPGARVNLSQIIPHVEGAHVGKIPIRELDQVVVTTPSMSIKVWNCDPAKVVDEVAQYIHDVPEDTPRPASRRDSPKP